MKKSLLILLIALAGVMSTNTGCKIQSDPLYKGATSIQIEAQSQGPFQVQWINPANDEWGKWVTVTNLETDRGVPKGYRYQFKIFAGDHQVRFLVKYYEGDKITEGTVEAGTISYVKLKKL